MAANAVLAALAKLESGKTIAIRNDALDEVRRLFGSKRNGSRAEVLGDDTYHRAFETLYQVVRTDRSAHLKALRSGSRITATTTRLESYAAALRLIVEAGYQHVKFKTAISVLDHVVEILPISEEELCKPLCTDYIKALRTLLEYPPLVEHLKPKQWQTYLDFVLAVLSISIGDEDTNKSFSSSREASISRNTNPLSIRVSQSHRSGRSHPASHAAVDDLLAILRCMAATTNAPVVSRAAEILDAVLECLHSTTRSPELALEAFNNVALTLLGCDVRLLRDKFAGLLPIARRLWSNRAPAIREQLLATFSLCQGIIIAQPESPIALDPETKSILLLSLQTEYVSRGLKDLLVSEDVELHFARTDSGDIEHDLVPSMSSSRSISQWVLLRTIAQLYYSLQVSCKSASSELENVERSTKRRRTGSLLGELLQQTIHASGSSQVAAVQILLLLVDGWTMKGLEDEIEQHMKPLSEILVNADSPATFWAFLVFSRLAPSPLGAKESLKQVWAHVLDAACRAASATPLARAACLTIVAITRNSRLKDLCSLTSLQGPLFPAGKSGPANLSDAAVWMFASLLQSSIVERDDAFESFSMKVLAWIGMHWVLPTSIDRAHNAHTAFHARPEVLCILFAALKGVELRVQYTARYTELPDLALLDERSQEAQKLAYLLSGLIAPSRLGHIGEISVRPVHLNGKTRGRLDFEVASMLQAKLRDFADSWAAFSASGRNTGVNNDVLIVATGLCVVSYVSTGRATEEPGPSNATQELSTEMWQSVQNLLMERGPESSQRVAIVAAMASRLADPTDTDGCFLAKQLLPCTLGVCKIAKDLSAIPDIEANDDIDVLDSLDTGTSQNSQALRNGTLSSVSRYELPDHGTPLQSSTSCILDLTLAVEQGRGDGNLSEQATAAVLEEVFPLDAAALISARHSIYHFLALQPEFTRDQVLKLLQVLGTVCLADSKFDRCEAVLSLCARVMTYLARYWTPSENDELDNCAYEIYEWFVSYGLGKGVLSPPTLRYLAHLLDAVASCSSGYGEDDLPSTRTSLFKILQEASCLTKLHITSDLRRIFGRFVLSEHGAIFDDIVDSLPSDADDLEGLGTRFYILAELGSSWHSVLRHATYSLFETAAHATSLIALQSSCIVRMCDALGLKSPTELFSMFGPQILYTWLGINTLNEIAYRAFSYDSLQALLTANEAEVMAQIALRGSRQHMNDLVAILGKPWKTLLLRNFARAEAYCLASQMTLPEKEQLSSHSEAAIRIELGTVQYGQSLQEEFPVIIATLFETLQDDVAVERALEKAGLDTAKAAFKAMSQDENSAYPHLSTQQPFFRSKFIIEEIRWLCSRVNLSDSDVWSSALLVRLFRSLLRTVHPALGPLYASAVLCKIRIVVALGGINSMRGYPLEMLLHNLRPYLTVFQCSGDAIAIYRYLLENGRDYLQTRLSFLSGVSVSIFASLTAFVSSSQDSTTQESHFRSTMTKAQDFRSWLAAYLGALSPSSEDSAKYGVFKTLVHHAQVMNGDGTSSVGAHQGLVLLSLLDDQASKAPLLQSIDFDLCISILCRNFMPATETSDDILASVSDAVRLLPVLERILWSPGVNPLFRTWVGQCIGRAISYQGPFVRPTGVMDTNRLNSSDKALTETASYQKIVSHWEQLLWKRDGKVAASAEQCLQTVASQMDPPQAAAVLGAKANIPLLSELRFDIMSCPALRSPSEAQGLKVSLEHWDRRQPLDWAGDLLIAVCAEAQQDPILCTLQQFVYREPEASHVLLPLAVHILLATELDGPRKARQYISAIFSALFANVSDHAVQNVRLALETIVYLRQCVMENETSTAQRTTWLEVDYAEAARAAIHCQLWHTALLFIELRQAQQHLSHSRSSRRSTTSTELQVPDCIVDIYQHVDDPDFFYAGHEDVDMESIVQRLNHESAGYKTLSFQSALYDSAGRSQIQGKDFMQHTLATAKALSSANLKGISQAVKDLVGSGPATTTSEPGNMAFSLLDWNTADNDPSGANAVTLQHLKTLSSAADKHTILSTLDQGIATIAVSLGLSQRLQQDRMAYMTSLAVLAEAKDALRTSGKASFETFLENLSQIESWGSKQDFESVSRFLSAREYIISSISRSPQLRAGISLSAPQALLGEALVVRQSLHLAQEHESHQFSLSRATYFSSLSRMAEPLGVNIRTAAEYDLAKTLWAQDERGAAVKILQRLRSSPDRSDQDIPVAMSEILAELGQRVTQARLEPPNEVIENYLVPAYKELGSDSSSGKAGQIFHIFAAFCDGQLQDADSRDEYMRLCQIKDNKEAELRELQRLMSEGHGKNRDQYSSAHQKAVTWYKLDHDEWERVRRNRESLVLRCLEHYLLSLKACDTYANDTLRVLTIWLEESDNPKATDTVGRHLKSVPSWKFAGLVNQLLSRLMDTDDGFQQCLMDLMFRICSDHPFHSLYQVFCASKSKANKADEVGSLRHKAAANLADTVLHKSRSREVWPTIHNLSMYFVKVAQAKLSDKQVRTGSKLLLREVPSGSELIRTVEHASKRIPPPTMQIAVRPSRDYKSVPVMAAFDPRVNIAGGISAPKIATITASDGSRHKLLMKGGNDDLRQDSIMEQVFEQVSNLLKDHRATRERKLGIRSYKVVPLLTNAGIIEFVQNTVPLNDYLMPAHIKYFPKGYSQKRGRSEIENAAGKPLQQRIQAYRTVAQNFPPVMRFFFMENFVDPDEWFYRRLNYSRSTAAISMLGHVLGLGDRHGHNILLDTTTGEVVHIDLGVAFEAGRVLPIPEVVPFRLTRDLVDGMGISGVEGVFRRCCNFTLEALRLEQESIMTILDVLRYDPLYSWSVSPLRVARMQENANRAAAAEQETNATDGTNVVAAAAKRRDIDESAEAARALAVVAKKLGKGLSVEATVNELIRQATDERNLAVLFCGWAAYA